MKDGDPGSSFSLMFEIRANKPFEPLDGLLFVGLTFTVRKSPGGPDFGYTKN